MPVLCLKDEVVLQATESSGSIKIVNPELLPLCLKDDCTYESFMKWLGDRCIPKEREGLAEVDSRFGTNWRNADGHKLSLNDHYWILKGNEKKWHQVSFFTTRYSEGIGDMFFSPWKISKTKFSPSPDLTCGGVLKKRWHQYDDKKSYLVKAAGVTTRQEPLNEVLVSVFCERLNKLACVKYDLCVEGVTMCSRCDNFVTADTDFVPASHIYFHEPRGNNESVLEHLLRMCEAFDIPGAEEHIKWTLFVDRSTGNTDRNLGNIGFIRDVKTLKFLGPAPLFDSGNAYMDTEYLPMGNKRCFSIEDEKKVYSEMKDLADLSLLDDNEYESIVARYPELNDERKEKLLKLIENKHNKLLGKVKDTNIER